MDHHNRLNLGYCCINLTLGKKKISVNNRCIKRTYDKLGLDYISELVIKNLSNLIQIIEWNETNDIRVYRMSSDMFPWMSEYTIDKLPRYDEISALAKTAGDTAIKYGHRLSFHPGPFNVLGSSNSNLVQKTTKELDQHAEIMDLMGLPKSRYYPINIHCNGVYGNKLATLSRWCDNYLNLSASAKARLVVENDDKASMYSVKDLYEGIYLNVRVPITFDYHHHRFNNGGLSEEDAFVLAANTWLYHGVKPLFHYSSCRKTFETNETKPQAHADFIYEIINHYGYNVDVELEAKAKELALLKYRETKNILLDSYIPLTEDAPI